MLSLTAFMNFKEIRLIGIPKYVFNHTQGTFDYLGYPKS